VVAASAGLATTPEDRCAAAKLRAAEKRARGLVACEARAALAGGSVDPACVAAVEQKFVLAWERIELRGGCATVGDAAAIESLVDGFVGDLTESLRTTTTTTPSTSCPTPTALYCGVSGCAPLPALCPSGMTCGTAAEGCGCTGPSIPCGDMRLSGPSGNFCRWGTCPAGMTCGQVPQTGACGFDCTCH
jgi:hypothetical protein